MRLKLSRTPRLLIASALATAACGCARTPALVAPPLADLTPTAKPVLGPDPTAATLDAYDIATEAFGLTEHGKVVRLCRWFQAMGTKDLNCEPTSTP